MTHKLKKIDASWDKDNNLEDIKWQKKKSTIDYQGKIFKIDVSTFEHPENKKDYDMTKVICGDWVNIFALTPNRELVVIEQFRFGNSQITLETPGGVIEKSEEPLKAAMRELTEETGFYSEKIKFIGESHPNPAIQSNKIYYYVATDCILKERKLDEGEVINTALISIPDFEKLIFANKVEHSLVLTGFLFFKKAIEEIH